MATQAALSTFRRVYNDPAAAARTQAESDRLADYRLLWAYYNNSAFADVAKWLTYRQANELYRGIRPIYNPTRRLVDFYAGVVYQGEWSADPAVMVEQGAAIPWSERTPLPLLTAVAQVQQWGNWQSKSGLMLRYAAARGDCLVVVVDNLERRKVYPDGILPGIVESIQLDPTGNVTSYMLRYDASVLDAAGKPTEQTYEYRREVTKTAIT